MNPFYAKNDKQLGVCLRMLAAEGISRVSVESHLNNRDKIEYTIRVKLTKKRYDELLERYKYLIA